MTPFPGKNPHKTTNPMILVELDEDGWYDINRVPLTEDRKYNIPTDFIPFIHPKGMARLLLEADLRKWKIPDDEEKISYSEIPAHEDYRFPSYLQKERVRYINPAGGLQTSFFLKLNKIEDFALIKLAAYHKAAKLTYIDREERMKGTEEFGINNIPYDHAFYAPDTLKEACAPFGKIEVVIWQGIDSSNYYHRGWALCYAAKEDAAAIRAALEEGKISVTGAQETRQVRLYASKFSQFNQANQKEDPTRKRSAF